ncbi:Nucleoside:H+ symporter:Major facilitator superfamily [Thioalkalivibrio nitratireducens DSM 14787]|uniref:Nucleoside:H+ symporter:Major facilitator superfamily n=1 Tax=Thioalkalivibrio nitratireducens (strain DSM 14787 / UNIQEM 213 / ALEN2) TaxID=1255043 RepID=L0E295_THIND|nr:MFS transporter [Thioalkalivibrio nitratireducens]AGA34776.1 Nucleoside:H+ symporter:Major facilitator superfamily [Thioalkalivibrio nitratireducens DSM 14787]
MGLRAPCRPNLVEPLSQHVRLSSFYFFYFASIGAFMPYWGPYLAEQGFTGAQIGELMAIVLATKIVAPNVWGWLADRSGVRMPIIRWGALAALFGFAGVLLHSGYWWLAAVMAGFSFFWNAILPQFEAVTLRALGRDSHRYALVRLWGSVGFIVAVAALGWLLGRIAVGWLPWMVLALLAGLYLASLQVHEPIEVDRSGDGTRPLASVLRRPEVIALLAACFFMQASHGPYYAFFTLYVEGQGFSRAVAGQLWALGVAAEVLLFLVMPRLILRFGAWILITLALLLATLRWWLLALVPETLSALLFIQLLHAASYGVYHAAAISLIHVYFPGRLQGRGQALYSSLSFGLGGGIGALGSGYLWDGVGHASVFVFAALLAAAGALVAVAGMLRTGTR